MGERLLITYRYSNSILCTRKTEVEFTFHEKGKKKFLLAPGRWKRKVCEYIIDSTEIKTFIHQAPNFSVFGHFSS